MDSAKPVGQMEDGSGVPGHSQLLPGRHQACQRFFDMIRERTSRFCCIFPPVPGVRCVLGALQSFEVGGEASLQTAVVDELLDDMSLYDPGGRFSALLSLSPNLIDPFLVLEEDISQLGCQLVQVRATVGARPERDRVAVPDQEVADLLCTANGAKFGHRSPLVIRRNVFTWICEGSFGRR